MAAVTMPQNLLESLLKVWQETECGLQEQSKGIECRQQPQNEPGNGSFPVTPSHGAADLGQACGLQLCESP